MAHPVRSALSLYAFGLLGVFLVVSPWTPVWRVATEGLLPEAVAVWAQSGWIRGMVSALGVLDLIAAGQVAMELWHGMNPRS